MHITANTADMVNEIQRTSEGEVSQCRVSTMWQYPSTIQTVQPVIRRFRFILSLPSPHLSLPFFSLQNRTIKNMFEQFKSPTGYHVRGTLPTPKNFSLTGPLIKKLSSSLILYVLIVGKLKKEMNCMWVWCH